MFSGLRYARLQVTWPDYCRYGYIPKLGAHGDDVKACTDPLGMLQSCG